MKRNFWTAQGSNFNPCDSMDLIRTLGKDNDETVDSSIQQFSDSSSDDSIQIQRDLKREKSDHNFARYNQKKYAEMTKPCSSKSQHQLVSSTMNKSVAEGWCDGFSNISPITAKKDRGPALLQAQEQKIALDIDHRILTSSPHDECARQTSRHPKAPTAEKREQGHLMDIEISSIHSLIDSSLVHAHLLPMTRGTINSDEIAPKSSSEGETETIGVGGKKLEALSFTPRPRTTLPGQAIPSLCKLGGEGDGEPSVKKQRTTSDNNSSRRKKSTVALMEGGGDGVARTKQSRSSRARTDRKSNALISSTTVAASVRAVPPAETGGCRHNYEAKLSATVVPQCSSNDDDDDVVLDPICVPCTLPKRTRTVDAHSRNKQFKVYLGPHDSEDDVPVDPQLYD